MNFDINNLFQLLKFVVCTNTYNCFKLSSKIQNVCLVDNEPVNKKMI
jgi:hypothetical protein